MNAVSIVKIDKNKEMSDDRGTKKKRTVLPFSGNFIDSHGIISDSKWNIFSFAFIRISFFASFSFVLNSMEMLIIRRYREQCCYTVEYHRTLNVEIEHKITIAYHFQDSINLQMKS